MMIGPWSMIVSIIVDSMLEEGLLDEARWLYDHYPDVQKPVKLATETLSYFKGSKALKKPVRP